MSLNRSSAVRQTEAELNCLPTILEDILSDKAPRPYTADAFFDFVSCRHCTESLDFIVRVHDYYEQYAMLQPSFHQMTTRQNARLGGEWRHLMGTFIAPGSVKEINLPSTIRNQLLSHNPIVSPPRPENLDSAFCHISEMLSHNILIPFLRSMPISDQEAIQQGFHPNHRWPGPSSAISYAQKSFMKTSPR
jgi:hypothetical protein